MTRLDPSRVIRSPRGPELSAKSWLTEAPLRMLMNNLDPDVAERPQELVVYGGIGRAARDWESFDTIVETLRRLEDDETLLVQSGKPVGVFRTHADAPRVLIANSNLVPHWATWDHFNELDRKGLAMYGQMTAGSWIYIGAQGIVQGTYETFVEMGRQHYDGDLSGRWLLTAGLGGMGGAQPLAAVMAGASCLAIECNPASIAMRLRTGYLDQRGREPGRGAGDHRARLSGEDAGVGGPARQRRRTPARAVRRGVRPDLLTDQTSAHDPVNGYLPAGWSLERWAGARAQNPKAVEEGRQGLDGLARARHARLPGGGRAYASTTATTSARSPATRASRTPSTSRASCQPTSARCSAGASGRSAGWRCRAIRRTSTSTDAKVRELMPDNAPLHRWLDMAREKIRFQGLPARICWVGLGDRHRLGLAFNEMVASRRAQGAHRHRPRPPRLRLRRQRPTARPRP